MNFKFCKRKYVLISCCSLIIAMLLVSCAGNESDEGQGVVTFININADAYEKFVGQTFKFSVFDNNNNNVTSESIIYVDGEAINGDLFTANELSTFEVTASYEGFESNSITVKSILSEGVNFRHRILYEDFTGTWCGYCPIAYIRYEKVHEQNENIVFVGVHGPVGAGDPYFNETSAAMHDYLNVIGHPTMYLNRNTLWEYNYNYTDVSLPLSLINIASKIGIEINSNLNGNTVEANVNLVFAENYSNLKLATYIVEDNLHYTQTNYFNGIGGSPIFYEGQYQVADYYHKNVLRDSPSGIQGIPIINSDLGEVFNHSFSYAIPSDQVANNLKIIVLVMNANGAVLNTREVSIDTDNTYEYL